ncbi:ABC transporter substrate-binding protein [Candidatus Sumerlaeota bacterium]|nr:ABC transporter substrate-binding protein [Candidatus Sumerlaeota bacterium]
MKSLRLISRIFIASLTICVWGCGKGNSSSSSASKDQASKPEDRVLRVSQGSDVLSMDPYAEFESPTICVLMNVYDTLTDIAPDMKIVPGLAESWRNLDPTHWEIKLRQNVKYHNGKTFDAEDAKFSLRRAMDWPKSRVRSEIPTIKDIQIADPYTLNIETTVPDAILPTRLSSIMILDKETTEEGMAQGGETWLATHANGTGAYKVEEWLKDQYCLLTANEKHWRGAPGVKKVKFLAMNNAATRVAAFLDGQLDLLCDLPVQDVDRIAAVKGYRVEKQPSLRLIYLGMDCGRDKSPGLPDSPPNPLRDLRVRRAIYHAINEDLIIEKVTNGLAAPAAQLFPDSIIGFDPEIKRLPYDPEKAKRLLAEAGYPKGFKVRLDSPNDRYVNDAKIVTAIAGQLAKVGIEVSVNAIPKAQFFKEERAGNCSFFLLGWTNGNGDAIGTFDHLLHTFDTAKNLGGANTSNAYSNPELDRISEASYSEFDPAKRADMLKQAVRTAMSDLPQIPLHFQMDIYAVSDKLDWSPRRDTEVRGIEVKWKP